MPDQIIKCVDCSEDFTHSEGAQGFFREKGFTEPPKRCKDCRKAKKDRMLKKGKLARKGGSR